MSAHRLAATRRNEFAFLMSTTFNDIEGGWGLYQAIATSTNRSPSAHKQSGSDEALLVISGTRNQTLGEVLAEGGFGQARHRPLSRAFADSGLTSDLSPRTSLTAQAHDSRDIHGHSGT